MFPEKWQKNGLYIRNIDETQLKISKILSRPYNSYIIPFVLMAYMHSTAMLMPLCLISIP